MTTFHQFGLAKPILVALAKEGHKTPTPIQVEAIPALLKGRDLLGIAQTGSGKTAAFTLPLLHQLNAKPAKLKAFRPRALILAPTRELASQVRDRIFAYGMGSRLQVGLVIGGVPINKQKNMVRRGVDILIATPGRLGDLIKQDAVSLDAIEYFVLDEVDQMLDMGFIHAIRAITAKLPKNRQSLFFSATMPREIERLANGLLRDPVRVETKHQAPPKIHQSVIHIDKSKKVDALIKIIREKTFTSGLVFSRTKHGANKIVQKLNGAGLSAQAIHGNRSQGQRERALKAFKSNEIGILVATDIAARGIDIQGVSHVINFDLPNVPETYVHRIGRTGRAGTTGTAISFCAPDERTELRAIERLIGKRLNSSKTEQAPSHAKRKKPRRPRNKRKGTPHLKTKTTVNHEADKVIDNLSIIRPAS